MTPEPDPAPDHRADVQEPDLELQDRRGKGLDLLRGRAAWHEALRCHVAVVSLHALETAGYPSLPRFCMLSPGPIKGID